MASIFITASGTDVGKTFVAAGLIRYLRGQGEEIDAVKPIVSGFDPARAGESDSGVLLRALGLPLTDEEIEDISPWRFAAPLSPDMAARHEGKDIDFDQLVSFCETAIKEADGSLLVEGVGGVMVTAIAQRQAGVAQRRAEGAFAEATSLKPWRQRADEMLVSTDAAGRGRK